MIRVHNTSDKSQAVAVTLAGRGVVTDATETLTLPPGARKELTLSALVVATDAKPGRHVIEVRTRDASGSEGCDCFFAVDVTP